MLKNLHPVQYNLLMQSNTIKNVVNFVTLLFAFINFDIAKVHTSNKLLIILFGIYMVNFRQYLFVSKLHNPKFVRTYTCMFTKEFIEISCFFKS